MEYAIIPHAECIHETPRGGLLIRLHDGRKVWVPEQAVHDDSDVYKAGTSGNLIIPLRMAEDKELDNYVLQE